MRWRSNYDGCELRVRTFFAWLPYKAGNNFIWLETITVTEMCRYGEWSYCFEGTK